MVAPAWAELVEQQPELAELFDGPEDPQLAEWLTSAKELLAGYFELEDPRRLQPEACELRVETELSSGVLLRGFIDRIDVAPTGEIRIVDYKTGAAPREVGEAKALFQMKFYALVVYRMRGVVPRQLRLMYLADRQSLAYAPDEAELIRFERTLDAVWQAILKAGKTGNFPQPQPPVRLVRPQVEVPGVRRHAAAVPGLAGTRRGSPGKRAGPSRLMGCFYEPLGDDVYRSTEHTVGPWSKGSQHMGPPSALLARQLEREAPDEDATLARITVEILGPVPIADLKVRSWVDRPGRSVQLVGAELAANNRTVARASAWWIAHTNTQDVTAGLPDPIQPKESGHQLTKPDGWQDGYLSAMEWWSIKGEMGQDGPATLWVRQLVATVNGETPTPLQRLMAVADSGNGASSRLNINQWLFINTELTVHLWRKPQGEWIAIDANTTIGPRGTGLATSTIHDEQGPVAIGAQALLVRKR